MEEFKPYAVLAIIVAIVILLVVDRIRTALVFFAGVILLYVSGIADTSLLLESFSNQSIITIFLLILLTAVVQDNYNLIGALDTLFKKAQSPRKFLFRMTFSVGSVSSIMNNTPIVALMIPYVYQWSRKAKTAPSKLMIPLSFAAILGGMITPIGTSTNLVLIGFLRSAGDPLLGLSDFILPGILVLIVGVIFLSTIGTKLLPSHDDVVDDMRQNIREYLAETEIPNGSDLHGKTVAEAELRNLDGIYLVEILRNGDAIRPVNPDEKLRQGDRLFFAGDTSRVVSLVEDLEGLTWSKKDKFQLGDEIDILEVVVPYNSKLEGKTLKESEFRENYDAAVVAIHRNGERVSGKLGEIKLASGDLLLLITGKQFSRLSNQDKDLYTVSVISKRNRQPAWKRWFFGSLVLGVIAIILTGLVSLFKGLIILFTAAVVLRLINAEGIKKNLNFDLFVILGSALVLGNIFIETGAAELVAKPFIEFLKPFGTTWILIGIFALTVLFTSFITNVAAVSILFPLVFQIIHDLNLNPLPVYLTLAFAASAAFITPVSYQTNLMVYGPGNYKFKDFLRIGLPFTLIYGAVVILFMLNFYEING